MCSSAGVGAGFVVDLVGTTSWGQFFHVLIATMSAIAMADAAAAAATMVASTVMTHHACLEFVSPSCAERVALRSVVNNSYNLSLGE